MNLKRQKYVDEILDEIGQDIYIINQDNLYNKNTISILRNLSVI